MRRTRARRQHLRRGDEQAAQQLAETTLAAAAPAVAEAMRALHGVVTITAYDAVTAAHDSLAPLCKAAIRQSRAILEQQHHSQCERITQLATRCRDEVAETRRCQEDQAGQLGSLRDLHAEQQEQARRFAEGYDWQIVKDFCFRFIRILDSMDEQLSALREGADPDHLRDVENVYREIQFALEASGVEQFRPEERTVFAGEEKRLNAVGTVPASTADDHGRVARVRMPGYLLNRENQADRILRPAHVEVFTAPDPQPQPQLQEAQS